MYHNIKVIENVIQNIVNERVVVKPTFEECSTVHFKVFYTEKKKIDKIAIDSFEISIQDNSCLEILNILPKEHQLVFKNYNFKLWEILHEIGHIKTTIGLSVRSVVEEPKKFFEELKRLNLTELEEQILYRQLVCERRADKWAYNWALKHPKQCEFIDHNLRVYMS